MKHHHIRVRCKGESLYMAEFDPMPLEPQGIPKVFTAIDIRRVYMEELWVFITGKGYDPQNLATFKKLTPNDSRITTRITPPIVLNHN